MRQHHQRPRTHYRAFESQSLTEIDERFDRNKTLLAGIDELHEQNKTVLEQNSALLARIAELEGRSDKPPKAPTNSSLLQLCGACIPSTITPRTAYKWWSLRSRWVAANTHVAKMHREPWPAVLPMETRGCANKTSLGVVRRRCAFRQWPGWHDRQTLTQARRAGPRKQSQAVMRVKQGR